MPYDTTRLAALGRQRRKLTGQLDANREELNPVVVEALQAGLPQARIAELAGMTREWVRLMARQAGIKPRTQPAGPV